MTASGANTKVSWTFRGRGRFKADGWVQVDYILIIQSDVDHTANPNEVKDSKYVSQQDLKQMFEDGSLKFTPWFKLICNTMLFEWWDHLDQGLDGYKGEREIRRM